MDARILCLTNVYGPRMALDIPGQGFLGNFLRKAILGEAIRVFGDGSQVRDPIFVDDVVNAFLLAGAAQNPKSRLWNLGGGTALTVGGIAEMASAAAGAPAPIYQPFPEVHKRIDIGSYRSDSRRIQEELGWQPHVDFQCGIRRALEYYRAELPFYLDPSDYKLPAPVETVAV
jgi:nucleoside-diphosphate-sugar epimerase